MKKRTVFEESGDTILIRPTDAQRRLSCSRKTAMEIAEKAHAVYRIGRNVFIVEKPLSDFLQNEAIQRKILIPTMK